MKNNNIQKGIFTALLLASPLVVNAGIKYPASDFQPKVVYQDSDYQHQSSSSTNVSFGEKAKADSNYPAATFEPTIVYQDQDYKHTKGIEVNKSIPLAVWEEKVEALEEANEEAASAEESSMNTLFVLAILAAGAFLYRKKAKTVTKVDNSDADGLTGVEKYLQNKTPKLSGVAKYLEENQSAPKSGVAKYVAKKIVDNKKAAAEKATGVEKYMRNQKRG